MTNLKSVLCFNEFTKRKDRSSFKEKTYRHFTAN